MQGARASATSSLTLILLLPARPRVEAERVPSILRHAGPNFTEENSDVPLSALERDSLASTNVARARSAAGVPTAGKNRNDRGDREADVARPA